MSRLHRPLLSVLLAVLLTGCVNDSASYMVGGDRTHAVTLTRAQPLFWEDKVDLSIVALRLPDCQGGGEVKGVHRSSKIALYQAPDQYPERIYILDIEGSQYAVSTESCRVQKFNTQVADKGERLGTFQETDGNLSFVAAKPDSR